jgi:hypothetical protein
MAELRITLQRATLLIERLIAMLVQPLAEMMSLLGRAIGILSLRSGCRAEVRTRRRSRFLPRRGRPRSLILRP